jgi:lysophospholipase L1-like esterase
MKLSNITLPKNYYKILMGLLMATGILLLVTVICLISFIVAGTPKDPVPPKDTEAESSAVSQPDDTSAPAVNPSVGQTPLPETPDAGLAYQDKLIFVGDSLTAHLVAREVLTGGKMTKQVWRTENNMLNLNSEVTAAKIIYPGTGEKMTVAQAAGRAKPEIMIITLGTDWGVSYLSESEFKACYSALIKDIQKASPKTEIILQSIFPVTAGCVTLDNSKINTANKWVKAIAAENDCHYLDTQSILKDDKGNLKAEYCNSTDGIHMGANAYVAILEYIRTHAIDD